MVLRNNARKSFVLSLAAHEPSLVQAELVLRAFPTVTSRAGWPSPPVLLLLTSLSVLHRKKLAICCCEVAWKPHCKATTNWNPFPAGGLFPSVPIWSGMREH